MTITKLKYSELPADEQSVIKQLYGAQSESENSYVTNRISYFRELTAQEKGCFGYKIALSPGVSILQTLYKIKGTLLPPRFSRAVNTAVLREDVLRLNFCPVGKRMLAVVFEARRDTPEIMFRNLTNLDDDEIDETIRKIMDAEIRRGFDPRTGNLLRFCVLHTGDEEYAVIVTAVRAVVEAFDVRRLFREALKLNQDEGQTSPTADFENFTAESLSESVRKYWTDVLSDLGPMPKLPNAKEKPKTVAGFSQEASYVTRIHGAVLSDLRDYAKSNKLLLMTMLQTAWGMLLLESNHCRDVVFCLSMPKREGSSFGDRGSQSTVPIRLKIDGNPTIKDLTAQAFKQFMVSQPYANAGKESIVDLLAEQGGSFNHVLDFFNFFVGEEAYSKTEALPDGKIVTQVSRDAQDICLSMDFRYYDNQVYLSLFYDKNVFEEKDIALFADQYLVSVQQMVTDWTLPYDAFSERLTARIENLLTDAQGQRQSDIRELQDYLFKLPLLQECDQGVIQQILQSARLGEGKSAAKLAVYFEGDRLSEQDMKDQMVFVINGKVSRSIEAGDGWYNTMDILRENGWVNDTVLLPDSKVKISAEVLTDKATILTVPLNVFISILPKSSLIARNIIYHTMRQTEKYRRLWVQS